MTHTMCLREYVAERNDVALRQELDFVLANVLESE